MSSNSTLKPKVQLNINEFSNLIALLSFLRIQRGVMVSFFLLVNNKSAEGIR